MIKKIIRVKGTTTKVNGTKPPNTFVKDELYGITKEQWEAGKFPDIPNNKRLDIGKFIVYGTVNKDETNTK